MSTMTEDEILAALDFDVEGIPDESTCRAVRTGPDCTNKARWEVHCRLCPLVVPICHQHLAELRILALMARPMQCHMCKGARQRLDDLVFITPLGGGAAS